jgi:hypothetical protein
MEIIQNQTKRNKFGSVGGDPCAVIILEPTATEYALSFFPEGQEAREHDMKD